MPRFVILRHEMPPTSERPSHWDLMLEEDGVLRTWSLPQAPEAPLTLAAERLPDHRLHYLDYEGPVSADRGTVTRYDQGTYTGGNTVPGRWECQLAGDRLRAELILSHDGSDQRWTAIFRAA